MQQDPSTNESAMASLSWDHIFLEPLDCFPMRILYHFALWMNNCHSIISVPQVEFSFSPLTHFLMEDNFQFQLPGNVASFLGIT